MKTSRLTLLFSLLAVLVLFASLGSAQTLTTGDVTGIVTDTTGAVVPGVTVTIRFTDTNETRTETTNDKGEYHFALLRPGDYVISAGKGSLRSEPEKFTLLLGQEQPMNLVMKVQGTQQLVEVNAQPASLETENANRTTSLSTTQVVDLPAPGGDLTTLAMTTPGIRVNIQGGSGNMNAEGIPGVSILFTLNGADVMDPYNNLNNSGASNNLLGQNEIAEAAVVLNAYSAQYGRMAGGQENLIGKSGTNAFHGNLLYNYNDRILNANDFFNNLSGTPKGIAISNQYGGSIGGPVWFPKIYNGKNKTFFFFDLEGLRYVLPTTGTVSIPTQPFQQYVLQHIPAASVPLYQDAFNLYNNAIGIGRAVPVTTGSGILQDSTGNLGCGTKGSFPGTPVGNGTYFGKAPAGATAIPCALAFQTNVSQLNTEDLLIARVDQNITDKQKINFRYEYDWGLQATAASPISPVFNSQSNQPQDQGQFNYTYVVSPTIVNSFIGATSWYSAIFGVANFKQAQTLMPERFTFSDGGANGGGFATVGATFPTGRNVGQAQAIDDLSWILGRHTVKLGVNYRYNKITDTSIASSSQEGTYAFNDLADFAAGSVAAVSSKALASSFTQAYPLLFAAHIRLYSLNFYGQDEWALTKNLKLTFGYRFERDGNPVCVDNCFARLNTQFGTIGYVGGANVPYNQSITTGLHTAYQSLEMIIPEPRFGFAWSPFGPNHMVIRGGVGLFANLFAGSVASNVFNNAPNKFTPSVPFGNVGFAADPTSGAYSAAASAAAFESGFSQGYTLTQIQTALGKIKFTPPGYYSPPQEFVAPKVWEWSFEIQQPLTVHNVLDVTYSGNHGYNQAINNYWPNFYIQTSNYPGGFGGLPTAPLDPRFYAVDQVLTSGYSNYNGLTAQLRHSFSFGFQGQVGYTWSHALGTAYTSTTLLLNPNNLRYQYSNLPFDTRHQVTGDILWNSPRLHNRALNWIAGGWTVGAKLFLYSGSPINITNTAIPSRLNSLYQSVTIEADLLAPYTAYLENTHCGKSTITTPCFVNTQFAAAQGNTYGDTSIQTDFGNIPPNSFYGPGYFDIDTQLIKSFHVTEHATFALLAQAYNTLNHPNFLNPSGSVTSGAFGKITSTASPPTSPYGSFEGSAVSGRVLVVGAKFNF
jgi:hypothetical protein